MQCILCKGKGQKSVPLCLPCQGELPWHPSQTIAFHYQPPIDHWITQLKFHQRLEYAKLLGLLFAEKLKNRNDLPEFIIPMPLHTRRLCKRGYNQALEIAKPLSRALSVPLNRRHLKRKKHTKPQSELHKAERVANVTDAFCCIKPIKANHIVLLDDVTTTGSTISAAYATLKQTEVSKIEIWCCASTDN